MRRIGTIEARLVLLTVTAGVAISAVGGTAVTSLRGMSQDSTRLSDVQSVLSRHQDADMMHDALRSDVLAAVPAAVPDRAAALLQTSRDAQQLRSDMAANAELVAALDDDALTQQFRATVPFLDAYALSAERLVALSGDPKAAQAALQGFSTDFAQARDQMALLTDRLRAHAARADAASTATATRVQRRTAAVAAAAMLLMLGFAGAVRRSVRQSLRQKEAAEQAVLEAKRTLEHEAGRERFTSTLKDAFDMAVDEVEATDVVRRTVREVVPGTRAELLLADNSRAHLTRVVEEPMGEAPGCGVVSPSECIAVRRGRTATFDSADGIGACPKLVGRADIGHAVCSPVTFLGEGLGVLHVVAPKGEVVDADAVRALGVTADETGSRMGTLRAFARSQLQANTDGLTGLLNRRTAEDRIAALQRSGHSFAVAMCDLDHFKTINDTFGHEAGDRALRVFSATLRTVMRSHDVVARYGGEEFLLVMPDCSAQAAQDVLDRVRSELELSLLGGGVPAFTASFGLTVATPDRPFEEALRVADTALLRAKAEGRNRTVVAGVGDAPLQQV